MPRGGADSRNGLSRKDHLILVAGSLTIALLAAGLLIKLCAALSSIFGFPVLRGNGGERLAFALLATAFFLIGWPVSVLLCRARVKSK
jgi:hypothetical protein